MIKKVLNKWDFVRKKPKSLLNIEYVNPNDFVIGVDTTIGIDYQFNPEIRLVDNNTTVFLVNDDGVQWNGSNIPTEERVREMVREEILRIVGPTEHL